MFIEGHPFFGRNKPAPAPESDAMKAIAEAFSQLQAPASAAQTPEQVQARVEGTPGYQFARDQGVKSILGNASALGLRQSGASVQDIGNYVGNSVAFPAFQDYMNRLASLSGTAQTASSGLGGAIGNLGASFGATNANLVQNSGNAMAAGQLGQAGAWQNTIGGLADILGDAFGSKSSVPVASDGRKYWGFTPN